MPKEGRKLNLQNQENNLQNSHDSFILMVCSQVCQIERLICKICTCLAFRVCLIHAVSDYKKRFYKKPLVDFQKIRNEGLVSF